MMKLLIHDLVNTYGSLHRREKYWKTWNKITDPWHIFIWNVRSEGDPGVLRNPLIPFSDIAHYDFSTQVQQRPTHIYVLMKIKFCQITSRDGTIPDSKAHGDNMGPIRDRQAEPCYLGWLKCKYSATGCQTLQIDTCDEILMAHISIKIVTYTNRIARIKQHLLWAHTRPRRFRHNLQRDMSSLEPPFVLDT